MIAIVGGGISGLTLGYFLKRNNQEFVIFEKENTCGGYIQSKQISDYLLELGPNSFLSNNENFQLFNDLEISKEILLPNDVANSRYILQNGKYEKIPTNPLKILFSNFLSSRSKYLIIKDLFSKKETINPNETVEQFFNKYFGNEITQKLVEPFLSGVYAGDISKMIMKEILPDIVKYKSENGSIIKGLAKNSSERKKSHTFKNGMTTIVSALFENVKSNIIYEEVTDISLERKINTNKNSYNFDKIVIAAPAYQIAHFQLFNFIKNINYAPMIVVHSAFKKADVKHFLNGFGGLNPSTENAFCLGSIWTSSIFENRCPADEVLFTTFVGGMKNQEKFLLKDEEIKVRVVDELCNHYNIISQKPVFQHLTRWKNAIPQYNNSYLGIKPNLLELENQNIYICSNWHNGISLTACINKAKNLSQKLSN